MSLSNIFALEGPDGSGKTTVTKLLVEHLNRLGRKATSVRMPGTTPFGEAMREILLMRQDIPLSTEVTALAFTAVNVSVMERAIELAQNSIVILDRTQWSNYAYRTAEGMTPERAMSFNQFLPFQSDAVHSLMLEAPIEVLAARLKAARGDKPDRFEGRDAGFQQRVYDGYQILKAIGLVTAIDGTREPQQIAEQIALHVVAHSAIGQQQAVFN